MVVIIIQFLDIELSIKTAETKYLKCYLFLCHQETINTSKCEDKIRSKINKNGKKK